MLKLIDTGSPLSAPSKTAKIPIGNYRRFMLRFFGTNQTSKNIDRTDIGDIILFRNGQQVRHLPFNFIHLRSNLKHGFAGYTRNSAGAFAITAWLDMELDGLPNTMDIQRSDEAYFRFQFDQTDPGIASATTLAAASWELYGAEDESIIESYELREYTHNIIAAGAGRPTEVLEGRNIGALFFIDAAPAVTNINVLRDKEQMFNGDDAALVEYTNMNNRVEAGLPIGEIPFVSKDPSNALNEEIILQPTFSGAGTLEVYVAELNFENSKPAASLARAQSGARRRLARQSKVTQEQVNLVSPLLRIDPGKLVVPRTRSSVFQ